MTNYCRNKMFCENLDLIKERYCNDKGEFTFDRVIAQPGWLDTDAPTMSDELWDWRCRCWGTKWDAINPEFSDCCLTFNTAWCPPEPVIKEMAIQSGFDVTVEFVCEGGGAGSITYHQGGSKEEHDFSNDWDFIASVWNEEPHEFLEDLGYSPEEIKEMLREVD